MHRKELVQEIIAAAAPIFIKKALKYLSSGNVPTEDELVTEVLTECEEVSEDRRASTVARPDNAEHVQYVGPYGNLVATLCMVIDDLVDDIKSQIKQEIMMKIHVELEQVRSDVRDAKLDITCAAKYTAGGAADPTAPYGGLPQFDVTEDETHLDTIKIGFSSIEKYATVAPSLANNPLFAMVEKSLERTAAGLSTHGAEDFNAARKDRSDEDVEKKIVKVEEEFYRTIDPTCDMTLFSSAGNDQFSNNNTEVDTDISANDHLWDKMFKDRYGK